MAICELCLAPVLSYCCCNSGSRKLWSTKRKTQRNLFHKVAASRFCGNHFLSLVLDLDEFALWKGGSEEKHKSSVITRDHQSNLVQWCFCTAGRQDPFGEKPMWWCLCRVVVSGVRGGWAIPIWGMPCARASALSLCYQGAVTTEEPLPILR